VRLSPRRRLRRACMPRLRRPSRALERTATSHSAPHTYGDCAAPFPHVPTGNRLGEKCGGFAYSDEWNVTNCQFFVGGNNTNTLVGCDTAWNAWVREIAPGVRLRRRTVTDTSCHRVRCCCRCCCCRAVQTGGLWPTLELDAAIWAVRATSATPAAPLRAVAGCCARC
jgi:hypothetical protein